MALWRVLLVVVVIALALPPPALAFRNAAVGSAVPALALDGRSVARVAVPASGRVTIVLFWRPGQTFSEEALADLAALAPSLGAKGVVTVAIAETGSQPKAAALPFEAASDRERQASDAYGVIVFPSTAVVDARGVLRAYVPSRSAAYRAVVEAHALLALGEITEPELTARLGRAGEVYGQSAEGAQAALKRGTALLAERNLEDAARELARALALQPNLTEAHLQLGWVRLEMNDPREAQKEFAVVLARNPTSPGARVGVGIARLRLGQTDEGIRQLEEAVVLNPEPVRGHYELGRAYEARGDTARAVYHYRWAFLKLLQGRK